LAWILGSVVGTIIGIKNKRIIKSKHYLMEAILICLVGALLIVPLVPISMRIIGFTIMLPVQGIMNLIKLIGI
jgi:hypothetical protein